MSYVDVNGAKLWVEEEGEGLAVLFLHGGLGDLRLFEPQARALSQRFRRPRDGDASTSTSGRRSRGACRARNSSSSTQTTT